MKLWHHLIFTLLLTVGLIGCGAQPAQPQAQEAAPAPPTETYTDENGFFTADYPAGWIVEPYGFGDEAPFPHVTFGSNQEIIDLSNAMKPLPEDQIAVAVMLLSSDMFAEAGVTAESSLEEVAPLVLASMAEGDEDIAQAMAKATIEPVNLSNGTPAVRVTAAAPSEAYIVRLADLGNGVYLFAPAVIAVDYHNAELEGQIEAIVNSVKVTASSEEVMAFVMEKMGGMEGMEETK